MENLYDVLESRCDDSYDDLKQAYQRLILLNHPDKVDHLEISQDEKLARKEQFLAINRAWKILGDDELRKEFDIRWQERCLAQDWPIDSEVHVEEFEEVEDGTVVYTCRCGGVYQLTPVDLTLRMDIVCCAWCSLSIKVTYDTVYDS